MGIQLDAYAKLWGIEGSNLAMNLRKVTREKHDYRAFLRKFARMGEQIRVNDDEFDYVFYTYGLRAIRQPATRGTSGICRGEAHPRLRHRHRHLGLHERRPGAQVHRAHLFYPG
ncbi:MAG: hypothetical protein ACLTDR_13990 [Adlercreutzia equolifaciens]